MTWHKLKTIKKPIRYINLPWYTWLYLGMGRVLYQEGVLLINEKGETKEVWEKLK